MAELIDEKVFIKLLIAYGEYDKKFIDFAKVQAKKFGWHRNRINYHIAKWEKTKKNL